MNGLPDDHGLDRCLRCGYSLNLTTTTCPECGAPRPTDSEIMDARRRTVAAKYSRPLFVAAILGPVVFVVCDVIARFRPSSAVVTDTAAQCCVATVVLSPLFAIAAVLQEDSRRNWIALGLNVAMFAVIAIRVATR